MNTGKPILLPHPQPPMPAEVLRYQKLLLKMAGAQRDVTVLLVEGHPAEHKNVDFVDTKDGVLMVYIDADNSLFRYPLHRVKLVEEKLKLTKSEE